MATPTIDAPDYLLFPSPRNEHRVVFAFTHFVPHPYAVIYLPDFDFIGKATLFSAQRKSDGRMGQVVSCELAVDLEIEDLEEQSLSRAERFAQKVGRRQQELVVEMQQTEQVIFIFKVA